MKTFACRLFELTLLITLFCGTSILCYDCGRRDAIPAPAAVQPVEPPAPEPEKPADEPPAEILSTVVEPVRAEALVPEPTQEPAPVLIRPKQECGPEPAKLIPVPEPEQPVQYQYPYQYNCRRSRRCWW